LNPIASDVKNARPAGKIFIYQDKIYRPSQNSAKIYGYGFNINEILILSETEYQEKVVEEVQPHWDDSILGTHTFNRVGNLSIIDAFSRRSRFI
jgi:hypothetical protein